MQARPRIPYVLTDADGGDHDALGYSDDPRSVPGLDGYTAAPRGEYGEPSKWDADLLFCGYAERYEPRGQRPRWVAVWRVKES